MNPTGFYHLCLAVPDLSAALAELSDAVGATFAEPRRSRLGEWDYELTFSAQGPPYLEVISGSAGSPWDVAEAGVHHVGFWSTDLERDSAELAATAPLAFDGCAFGRRFAYHRLGAAGLTVELLDVGYQADWRAEWAPDAPAMPHLFD